jgi:MscS family membrane protein
MFVPNGKLADATVNNLGTRRHRVTKAKLLVAHGTGADQLAAFMAGLAALVLDVPHVQPGSVQVGVASITPDGIEVEVSCCLDVRSAADERADKTALMLGVLRLADRMRVRLGDLDYAASGDDAVPKDDATPRNDATPKLGAAAE